MSTEVDEVKRICIVGGGSGGLAALKMIMDTQQYKDGLWQATVFEEREKVGGVWVPAPPVDDPPVTPLYDSLTTNLPHPIMCYESFLFPPETPLFPPAATVEKYLSDYTIHFGLTPHIRLQTQVKAVDWLPDTQKWKVRVEAHGLTEEPLYDLLLVANGHYRAPRYPTTPGLDAWRAAGKATHSAWYRRPAHMGDTVLVVGGGPSGTDISAEMRTVARVVIHSVSQPPPHKPQVQYGDLESGRFKVRPRVAAFGDVHEGRVVFEDGSEEAGVDHCILATGYQHDQPFMPPTLLKVEVPPPVPPLPPTLYNSTYHLFPVARHLFPLTQTVPPSRLAFLGLLKGVAPLPLMEAQIRAALAVFADPALFDAEREAADVVARYEHLRARFGSAASATHIAAAWHVFAPQMQYDYRDELHALIGHAARVPEWVREMYDVRDVLRREWRDLERIGEAQDWVRGVGGGGVDDWVELMRRVLKRAQDRPKEEEGVEAALARAEGKDGGEVRIARPPAEPSEEKYVSKCLVN
ncbi:FAD/NAD(P)-binding domain-containing protein [Daedalea quercina L-15889]|uniref:FAD/NAD(P)-binding domain-containing protein n=1 Tax=Daedalea quercina L-15889 TaxID=1314783 RepID=A0A165M7A7_9APHY|nr:FAD/NAD(P)-binding domain-containing protein [Daedalea quercina L-15889]